MFADDVFLGLLMTIRAIAAFLTVSRLEKVARTSRLLYVIIMSALFFQHFGRDGQRMKKKAGGHSKLAELDGNDNKPSVPRRNRL